MNAPGRHGPARPIARWTYAFVGLSLALPGTAWAAAPLNDNYLASTQMTRADGKVAREYREVVDTTAATVQADLFDPDREGVKFGGGPPENTRCGQTVFGATVWYDFAPDISGGVEIVAGGYDAVVTVYEYDVKTARITRTVACSDRPGVGENMLLPDVRKGVHYTIQVGGAAATAGALDFRFNFYGDRDEDEVLDLSDKCPRVRGVAEAGGCPPELRTAPQVVWAGESGGVRVQRVLVSAVPVGAKVEVRCRRCGARQVRRARGTIVAMSQFAGKRIPDGAALEILVTRAPAARGRYRFGAIGNYYRYTVRNGRMGSRINRCLKPRSPVPRKRCT